MVYKYPVARREHCASCAQIEQEIRETETLMRNIKEHLHNAKMDALTNAMAGLSAGQMERELEELEETTRKLRNK